MCDVGGHISSDMITWQCACCGTAIKDADNATEGLCDLGICLSCRNAPDNWMEFVKKNGKKVFVWIAHHPAVSSDNVY